MKQLKFMLAAATAVGIAAAAQASYLSGSTDFESGTVASLFTYNGAAAEPNDENESAIVEGAAEGVAVGNNNFGGTHNFKLKVNTGTTPILRSVNGTDEGASLATGNVYVDTLVQFTVTPKDDDPTPATENGVVKDKLMVYLKERATEVDGQTVLSTNLCVKGGYCAAAGGAVSVKEYVLTVGNGVEIVPNKWYRLTVTAYGNVASVGTYPAYSIKLDGNACTLDSMTFDANSAAPAFLTSQYQTDLVAKSIVLSMVQESKIKSVGFAGEGEVDDLVISTFNPAKTVVDFTLTLAGDAANGLLGNITYTTDASSGTLASGANLVSAYQGDTVTVSYTLAENYKADWSSVVINDQFEVAADQADLTLTITKNAPSTVDFTFVKGDGVNAVTYTINNNEPTAKVKAGDVIKITDVDYADLYVAGTVGKGYTQTITAAEVAAGVAISVTVDAKPLTGEGAVVVPDGTTAENIGINTETTGLADASATELTAIVKWADTYKATGKTALDAINAMVFDGKEPKNDAADAFLLNCDPNDAEKLKAAKDAFKFEDFNASSVDTWLAGAIETLKAAYPNGNVVPQRAEDLGEWYGDDDEKPEGFDPKFFRAKLIRK